MTAAPELFERRPDALARTVSYLARQLSPRQVRTLRALAGVDGATLPRHEWRTTYDALEGMGLIDRPTVYAGEVTTIGRAVLIRLGEWSAR